MSDAAMMAQQIRRIAEAFVPLGRAMRQATFAAKKMGRPLARILYTPGDRHIESVVQSILRGEPGYTTSDPVVRLTAAADFAEVLDRLER